MFRSCVEVAGYTVHASERDIKNLSEYVQKLGLCFQIKDDIFDYFKDEAVGKPTGNDLREGKVTLPLIYAISKDTPKAPEMKKLLMKDCLSDEEIETLIEFAKAEGGIEYAYAEMERIEKEAKDILKEYPDSEAKEAFLSLFQFIIKRHK